MQDPQSRRHFLAALPVLAAAMATGGWARFRPAPARAHGGCEGMGMATRRAQGGHPAPRPGIDASKVLKRDQLEENPDAAPIFDQVREMPQIADGIRCHCGCSEIPGKRSLLSCYEEDGMAQHCTVCQGQAKTAHRLFKQGKTLNQIRAAVDEEFG